MLLQVAKSWLKVAYEDKNRRYLKNISKRRFINELKISQFIWRKYL